MSHKKIQRHTVKGFTLMELIIVIAIIGVLLGILMPSLMNYYRRSKIQEANADAKMVYNAAQTAVQRYLIADRPLADADRSGFAGVVKISYNGEGGVDCVNGALSQFPSSDSTRANQAECQRVVTAVNRTVSDAPDVCWSVYIDNYIVKAAVSAANNTTANVGYYSANRQAASLDDRGTYAQYLTRTGTNADDPGSLIKLAHDYDHVPTTEAATEATT